MGALSFNEMEIDALGEMMNISLGASATAMSTLLGSPVHITTPKVKILTRDQFEFKKLEPAVGVEIAYVEGLEGSNIMMFSRNDVRIIVGTLLGEELSDDEFELDEILKNEISLYPNETVTGGICRSGRNIVTSIAPVIKVEVSYAKGNTKKRIKFLRCICFTGTYDDNALMKGELNEISKKLN